MIKAIVLSLLCLALASLVLRIGLFFLGKDKGRLAKITSITQSIGMVPVTAFARVSNLVMFGLLLFMLAYWVAPQQIMNLLGAN
jgi:hypothetical protein